MLIQVSLEFLKATACPCVASIVTGIYSMLIASLIYTVVPIVVQRNIKGEKLMPVFLTNINHPLCCNDLCLWILIRKQEDETRTTFIFAHLFSRVKSIFKVRWSCCIEWCFSLYLVNVPWNQTLACRSTWQTPLLTNQDVLLLSLCCIFL